MEDRPPAEVRFVSGNQAGSLGSVNADALHRVTAASVQPAKESRATAMRVVDRASFDRIRGELARIYTPAAPITEEALFSGRIELLEKCRSVMSESGATLILYGDRGIGKTSLSNVLLHGKRSVREIASGDSTFVSLFRNVLATLGMHLTFVEDSTTHKGAVKGGPLTGERTRTGKSVPVALEQLDLNFLVDRIEATQKRVDAIVIDELERINGSEVRDSIIEVAKGWADRRLDVLLVLLGVGSTPQHVVGGRGLEHYLDRNLYAIRVPPMTREEVHDVIRVREGLGVRATRQATDAIVDLSGGYPWLVHRLMKGAVDEWISVHVRTETPSLAARLLRRTVSLASLQIEIGPTELGRAAAQLAAPKLASRSAAMRAALAGLGHSVQRMTWDRMADVLKDSDRAPSWTMTPDPAWTIQRNPPSSLDPYFKSELPELGKWHDPAEPLSEDLERFHTKPTPASGYIFRLGPTDPPKLAQPPSTVTNEPPGGTAPTMGAPQETCDGVISDPAFAARMLLQLALEPGSGPKRVLLALWASASPWQVGVIARRAHLSEPELRRIAQSALAETVRLVEDKLEPAMDEVDLRFIIAASMQPLI